MDTSEGTQVGAERRTRPFAGVAVDLASAIPIIIPRPFVHAMADRGMGRMAAAVALPFVGIEHRAAAAGTFSAMRSAQVRLSAWSQTQKRCSPVSREMMLMMGGRSLA